VKIAVAYNRESRNVINLFGMPNKETIGLRTIKRISDALRQGGHQVIAVEGDKDLVDRLEEFMPRVVKGERPGMVFNVSYGIQGQARYTHVPGILEMVGVPYVGSGPLAHSLSLDKVVTKMILRQNELPTPEFHVLDALDAALPELEYPMIVKPKNEAVSFGLKVVHDEAELRQAATVIFEEYGQSVLVERYVEGREVNVGLMGNGPPEALPPVELMFGEGPSIYTYEDKTGKSGRQISHRCPAEIGEELNRRAQELAIRAFTVLGCADCARVDMRLDDDGNLYILEVNSLPSLGEHGSYLVGAEHIGLDFAGVVNRLVEEASARYFGTPEPPHLDAPKTPSTQIFSYVTQRRDVMEKRLRDLSQHVSHTDDPIGVQAAVRRADRMLVEIGLKPVPELTDERSAWVWETTRGMEGGDLLIAHLDVPTTNESHTPVFRKEPEWLYGDGIGSVRAPLVMLEMALRAVRSVRRLRQRPIGVLLYTDEGRDARYSAERIRIASERARRVLVLRPGNVGDAVLTQRRGQRKYRFRAVDEPRRPGKVSKSPELLRWVWGRLEEFSALSDRSRRISVSTLDIRPEMLPMLLPHRVTCQLLVTYPKSGVADEIEGRMRESLGHRVPKWELELISDRPPMVDRRASLGLARTLEQVAQRWEIPFRRESSVWPSVAGLVGGKTACVCGLGPVARDLGTPQEAVQRISLVQRTLLLADYLGGERED
jgi:D-alanine-D-alanine ligase